MTSTIKNFSAPPYFDDFDELNNYMRVLYRPGFPVQARELNQQQTTMQAQLDRFGRHLFKDGTPVVGGNATLDSDVSYIKVESSFTHNSINYVPDNYFEDLIGQELTGLDTGVRAVVVDALAPADGDPLTLFVKYTSTGTDTVTKVFDPEEVLQSDNGTPLFVKVQDAGSTPQGKSTRVAVDEGAFFISGTFVYVPADSLVVSKYASTGSARIVYNVMENVITPADDITLTDNALGTPNEAAPGAHRYQVKLELGMQDADFANRDEDNIIQLLVIEEGRVIKTARTALSELGDNLAQRTFEESGNYTLRPFQIDLKEHLKDVSKGGDYQYGQYNLAQGGDDTKVAVGLEKSVAYVNGYRIEIEDTKYIETDKGRDTFYYNVASLFAPVGNYIVVNDITSTPDIDSFTTAQFQDVGSATVGTCRIRAMDYVSGTPGTSGAEYRVYVFDVSMNTGKSMSDVDKIVQTNTGSAVFDATLTTKTIFDSANNSLVFDLPFGVVDTLRGPLGEIETLYNVKKTFHNRAVVSNSVTVTADAESLFTSTSSTDWIVADVSTGAIYDSHGKITLGGSPAGTTATIDMTGFGAANVDIIGVQRKNLIEKNKSLVSDAEYVITSPTGNDRLNKADVYKIKAIHESSSSGTTPTTADPDIIDRYEFDDGQRDSFYDLGGIILKNGSITPTGQLLVVFDYFSHGVGDYFSVDSYTNIEYEKIPGFQSNRGLLSLRDSLDFRPRVSDIGGDFTASGSSTSDIIKPNSIITADVTFYLPRIDRVILDKNGLFSVVQGISAQNPKPPADPKEGMVLYELLISPYTFSPKDIIPRLIDNKRYTMRDIGKLDRRINNLEYYTSLSLLEKQTADSQIFDELGAQRFKNGFIVDSFYGHNIGDVSHPDYKASIDRRNGILRPHFFEDNTRLIYDATGSTNIRKTGDLLTLDYSEVAAIEQPYASYAEFVNPYDVFGWQGNLKLSPEQDEWKETEQRPEVIVDQEGIYDSILGVINETDALGTIWNEWETNWVGESLISRNSTLFDTIRETSSQRAGFVGGRGIQTIHTDTTTNLFQERSTFAVTTDQSRSGIRTDVVPDTITSDLGDRVVEVNFVPFIRSRKISFKASLLKPNTKMFLFFDNQPISDYARADTFESFSDSDEVRIYRGIDENNLPYASTDLVTDASGNIEGYFIIPNNSDIRIKTGTRVVKITDSEDNVADEETTFAESIYEARGLVETKENVVVSTRVPRIERTEISSDRVLRSRTSRITGLNATQTQSQRITYHDPLAQTFIIDQDGGAFITSLDLFVETKDSNPIFVQIRTVENGIPTPRIVPFGEVIVDSADINVSADASVSTRFTFPSPVYLLPNVEYAFVVMTKSDVPKIFVSEMGGSDVTNPEYRITKQPYNGVMFKSQNASTWTPEQNKDIKFTLNRADFVTSGSVGITNASIDSSNLTTDPISTTSGSNIIRVYHKNHGLFDGISDVELSDVEGTTATHLNGIPLTEINKTHTVGVTEQDYYSLTVVTNASASGRAGGSDIRATENKTIDTFHTQLATINPAGTVADWGVKLTTGQSIAAKSSQAPHIIQTVYSPITINENITALRPFTIVAENNEAKLSTPNAKSFQLISNWATTSSNVSPVIDMERASVITVANRIDNPAAVTNDGFNVVENFVDETAPTGGSALAKYMTRRVDLAEPAESLKIFAAVNKPNNTNIELYYKLLPAGSSEDFQQIDWVEANPDTVVPTSDDTNKYSEVEYTLVEDDIDNIEFSAFAIKIVLKATNSSVIPTCKDLRAIALV